MIPLYLTGPIILRFAPREATLYLPLLGPPLLLTELPATSPKLAPEEETSDVLREGYGYMSTG